jgi:hypothetical protein
VSLNRGQTLKICAAPTNARSELFLFKTRVTKESGPLFGSQEVEFLRPLESNVGELAEPVLTMGQTGRSGDCTRQMR